MVYRRRDAVVSVVLTMAALVAGWGAMHAGMRVWGAGSDAGLNGRLDDEDARALGLKGVQVEAARAAPGNPWRGAGRRHRHDVIVAVSGCGGRMRPALRSGGSGVVRYVTRASDGHIIEGGVDSVGIILGSGQVSGEVEGVLRGLCGGEVAWTKMRDGKRLMAYVERVEAASSSWSSRSSWSSWSSWSSLSSSSASTSFSHGRAWETARREEVARSVDAAARAVRPSRGRRGASCAATCKHGGLVCAGELFAVVNNCPRLRAAFNCTECAVAPVEAAGADMPAWVVQTAPRGHARGACLVSPRAAASHCSARYPHTKRLCPCVERARALQLQQRLPGAAGGRVQMDDSANGDG